MVCGIFGCKVFHSLELGWFLGGVVPETFAQGLKPVLVGVVCGGTEVPPVQSKTHLADPPYKSALQNRTTKPSCNAIGSTPFCFCPYIYCKQVDRVSMPSFERFYVMSFVGVAEIPGGWGGLTSGFRGALERAVACLEGRYPTLYLAGETSSDSPQSASRWSCESRMWRPASAYFAAICVEETKLFTCANSGRADCAPALVDFSSAA